MKLDKNMDILKILKVILYLFIIGILLYIYIVFIYVSDDSLLGHISDTNISSGEIEDSIMNTIDIKDAGVSIQDLKSNGCDTDNLEGYDVVSIFKERRVGFDKFDYKDYSNKFTVTKGVKEAYFCIVADVQDQLKTRDGDYYLYVFVNWGYMGGLVNVGYSVTNKVYYDYTTAYNSDLDGRMYGLETPKTYLLDLSNLIVANYPNGGYKVIKPIDQLNIGGAQTIGGFISAGEGGIIDKFVLIYTGGNVKLK